MTRETDKTLHCTVKYAEDLADEVAEKVSEKDAQIEANKSAIEQLESQMSTKDNEVASLDARITSAQTDIAAAKTDIAALTESKLDATSVIMPEEGYDEEMRVAPSIKLVKSLIEPIRDEVDLAQADAAEAKDTANAALGSATEAADIANTAKADAETASAAATGAQTAAESAQTAAEAAAAKAEQKTDGKADAELGGTCELYINEFLRMKWDTENETWLWRQVMPNPTEYSTYTLGDTLTDSAGNSYTFQRLDEPTRITGTSNWTAANFCLLGTGEMMVFTTEYFHDASFYMSVAESFTQHEKSLATKAELAAKLDATAQAADSAKLGGTAAGDYATKVYVAEVVGDIETALAEV